MAKESNRKVILGAYALVVVVSAVLGIFIGRVYLLGRAKARPQPIAVGSPLRERGIDWAKSDRTLVLALAKDCHFCSDSAEFYRRLAPECAAKRIRTVALVPHDVEEGRRYLAEMGVPVDEVRQSPLMELGFRGTPTLALVDGNGTITNIWAGKLSPAKEQLLLDTLKQ